MLSVSHEQCCWQASRHVRSALQVAAHDAATRCRPPSFFAEFAAAAPTAAAVHAAAGRRPRRQRGAPSSGALAQQVQDTLASVLGRQVAADEPLVAAGLNFGLAPGEAHCK